MKIIKKIAILFTIITMTALLLTGCSSNEPIEIYLKDIVKFEGCTKIDNFHNSGTFTIDDPKEIDYIITELSTVKIKDVGLELKDMPIGTGGLSFHTPDGVVGFSGNGNVICTPIEKLYQVSGEKLGEILRYCDDLIEKS